MVVSQPPQLFINNRNQLFQRLVVSAAPLAQQTADPTLDLCHFHASFGRLYHPRSKKLFQAGYQFGLPAALSVVRRKFMKSKMLIFAPAVSIVAALAAAQST